jgi:hypothetical protein
MYREQNMYSRLYIPQAGTKNLAAVLTTKLI